MRKSPALCVLAIVCAVLPLATFAGGGDKITGPDSGFSRDTSSGHAGAFRNIWHYVTTHKELLANDAIEIAAWSADAASTIDVQRNCPSCVEANPIVGPHPSAGVVWSYAIGMAGTHTALNHLIWHYAPETTDRHLIWASTSIVAINELFNVHGNVTPAERGTPLARISPSPTGFNEHPYSHFFHPGGVRADTRK